MIRDADRALKDRVGPRRLRLDRRPQPPAPTRSGPHVRVDGSDWFDGAAGCVLVGNVGTVLGGLTAVPGRRARRRPSSRSASSRRTGALHWARVLGAPGRRAARRARRSSRTTAGRDDRGDARAPRCPTSSTAATARRPSTSSSRVEPAAVTVVRARGGRPMSTATTRPRDRRAHRRRRPRDPARRSGSGASCSDAFLRLRFADGFSHARSLAFLGALVLVQGDHRRRRPGQRPRHRRADPRHRPAPSTTSRPARPAAADRRRWTRPGRTAPSGDARPSSSASSARSSPAPPRWASSSGA